MLATPPTHCQGYNESLAKTVAVLSFASESSSRGMTSGIKSRHEREVPHLVKSFHALEAKYGALADQAEFLLSRQGAYTRTAAGLEFADTSTIEPRNELYRKIQCTVAQVNAVQKEGAELEQYQSEGWAKMQEGLN